MKNRNWFMQQLLWSFFSQFVNYRPLPVPAQNYLKYCFSQIVTKDSQLVQRENQINLARCKVFLLPYLLSGIARSYTFNKNLKIIKWKTYIGYCRSSFRHSFPNWEITGLYQFLFKSFWNTAFLNYLL